MRTPLRPIGGELDGTFEVAGVGLQVVDGVEAVGAVEGGTCAVAGAVAGSASSACGNLSDGGRCTGVCRCAPNRGECISSLLWRPCSRCHWLPEVLPGRRNPTPVNPSERAPQQSRLR